MKRFGHGRSRLDPTKDLVGFLVGAVHYAIDIQCVREITKPLPLVALAHAKEPIVGVADYRGEVIPVIDLRLYLSSPAVETKKTKWIVFQAEGRAAAMIVDAVTDVFGAGSTELRESPSLGEGDVERGIRGVASIRGEMAFVMDTAKLAELSRRASHTRQAKALIEGA
jgi:purine-binding chemotaxis protein CheW